MKPSVALTTALSGAYLARAIKIDIVSLEMVVPILGSYARTGAMPSVISSLDARAGRAQGPQAIDRAASRVAVGQQSRNRLSQSSRFPRPTSNPNSSLPRATHSITFLLADVMVVWSGGR